MVLGLKISEKCNTINFVDLSSMKLCGQVHKYEAVLGALEKLRKTIWVKKIQEFDVIQFYLNHLQFSNASTDTTVILKEKMLNEKST